MVRENYESLREVRSPELRNQKAHFVVVIAILCLSFMSSLAAPKGQGFRSCYQEVLIDQPGEYNFLENTFYQFFYIGDANVAAWKIELWDWEGTPILTDYDAMGLTQGGFSGISELITAKLYDDGQARFNRNLFILDGAVKTLRITPYFMAGGVLEEGQGQTTVNLKTTEEAFTFKNKYQSCFTFDNFIPIFETVLNGLCYQPSAQIEIGKPLEPGWSDFVNDLQWNDELIVPTPTNFCESRCSNTTASPSIPDPVPCGCISYVLTITLTPCDGVPQSEPAIYFCPPKEWTIPIEVCCECDVRESPPAN